MTPSGVGRLCRDADPGRAVLTHIYPPCDALDLESLVREHWRGDVVRAVDGMLLTVPASPHPTRKEPA
jgi:ribonuclease BN (tRNA processing enzyme)